MDAEKELRQLILEDLRELKKDIKSIREDMATLKVKVALFSSVIASGATLAAKKLFGA
jgi:hypothetical protein